MSAATGCLFALTLSLRNYVASASSLSVWLLPKPCSSRKQGSVIKGYAWWTAPLPSPCTEHSGVRDGPWGSAKLTELDVSLVVTPATKKPALPTIVPGGRFRCQRNPFHILQDEEETKQKCRGWKGLAGWLTDGSHRREYNQQSVPSLARRMTIRDNTLQLVIQRAPTTP